MKTIQRQITLLLDAPTRRILVSFQINRKSPSDKVDQDVDMARKENKELDVWVEGYVKRLPMEQLQREEVDLIF